MARNNNKKHNVIGFMALAVMSVAPMAWASQSEPTRAQTEKEFHATFEQMLVNPADLETTMHYADLAIKLQDYEAAIPALERVLMFNPDLAETKLELGILYYNLKSYDMAKAYLSDTKETKNVSPEVVAQANDYLSRM